VEERKAGYRIGLESQANLYGVSVEEAALGFRGTGGPGRRAGREDDDLAETGWALLRLVDPHPVIAVIVFPLLPLLALAWRRRRLFRPATEDA